MQSSGNDMSPSSGDVMMAFTGNEMVPSVDRLPLLHPMRAKISDFGTMLLDSIGHDWTPDLESVNTPSTGKETNY